MSHQRDVIVLFNRLSLLFKLPLLMPLALSIRSYHSLVFCFSCLNYKQIFKCSESVCSMLFLILFCLFFFISAFLDGQSI